MGWRYTCVRRPSRGLTESCTPNMSCGVTKASHHVLTHLFRTRVQQSPTDQTKSGLEAKQRSSPDQTKVRFGEKAATMNKAATRKGAMRMTTIVRLVPARRGKNVHVHVQWPTRRTMSWRYRSLHATGCKKQQSMMLHVHAALSHPVACTVITPIYGQQHYAAQLSVIFPARI